MVNTDQVMTLSEVARYLKIGERTLLKMVNSGKIPAVKIGNQWRFMSAVVDRWLDSKLSARSRDELTRLIELDDASVPLSRLIKPQLIDLDLQPGNPREVLTQLTAPFVRSGEIDADDQSRLVENLAYRESILSTAIEENIAFPHLRTPAENPIAGPLIHIARCLPGTNFGSKDGSITYLFFFICTDSIAVHLRVMARLAQAVLKHDLATRIMAANSGEEVLASFLERGI